MKRAPAVVVVLAAVLAVGACGGSSRAECERQFRADYQRQYGVAPAKALVDQQCRSSRNNRYYGTGSRFRGGGVGSGK